jgi:endonuclease-3
MATSEAADRTEQAEASGHDATKEAGMAKETATHADSEPREQVARIYALLVAAYGVPAWEPEGDPLGELIATVLSQHTSDTNSARAYAQLIARFPSWEAVRDAPTSDVADAIRQGGLAQVKAARIQQILRELTQRLDGAPLSLEHLRALPLDEGMAYLRTFTGVGPKTAACVLLFSVGQPAFPVDTHVGRVCRRLGLIGPRTTADAAHALLAELIPPAWRHTIHVDLIRHGRQICHAQNPRCGACPLRAECQYYWQRAESGAG